MNDLLNAGRSTCGLILTVCLMMGLSTWVSAQPYAVYAEGDLFVQSDVGSFEIGFPDNGNLWRLSTGGDGQNLLFQHKPDRSSLVDTQYTLDGDTGFFGIGGFPTGRAHIFQQSQTVGTGLRFTDNTANEDWDITHGFALRFHYGGSLRGFINANTGAYTQSSDRRLKEGARPMPSVLNNVARLSPLMYRYKNDNSKREVSGFMAQDVLPLFPELVSYSEPDDLYGVDYAGFSVIAIKAVQELKTQLDQRDREITALQQRIQDIERRLNCGNTLHDPTLPCSDMTLSQVD